jgi:predicted PurR-regulated permease PerM
MLDLHSFLRGDSIRTALPVVLEKTWSVIINSVGGFLGVFGFLLSMIIVPIYLYYFLIEARHISQSWGDYLPLRASEFKDEVVAAFNEINGYLIAFFRGQLLVSLINGTVTGILLMIVGLDFGLLIGLVLCFLGIIPYLGIILCWIPAVIIASVQGGVGTWIPGDHWWVFPLVVTLIFVVVQQIDGLFITPRIVGESVGLHPMTVMASVFVWSLLIGGLLGAIVAVPLTATIKVLLRRYVWQRTLFPATTMATEETVAIQQAQDPAKTATTPVAP